MSAGPSLLDTPDVRRLIDAAIDEDLGAGDLTAGLLPEPERMVEAALVPRAPGIVSGLALAPLIARAFGQRLARTVEFATAAADGDRVTPGQRVARLVGPHAAVLTLERTLLNFICRLSGVATLTRRFVDAARAGNPNTRIFDTRKTIPGWRTLDKYAVRCGGGHNHRMGLYDAVLIKDNHIAGVASAGLASHFAALIRRLPATPAFIEVEVDRLDQFAAACQTPGIEVILLDNFALADLRTAVERRDALGLRGRVELEASGGISLETVGTTAATGVDRIAVGAITHSATALDFGLDL